MKKLLSLTFIFSLCGCTTVTFVRKDLKPEKKAILRYLPQSSEKNEAKYREKVASEAKTFCGGEYKITKEYQAREETGSSTGVGTGVGFGMGGIMLGGSSRNTALYNFIEIVCDPVAKGAARLNRAQTKFQS